MKMTRDFIVKFSIDDTYAEEFAETCEEVIRCRGCLHFVESEVHPVLNRCLFWDVEGNYPFDYCSKGVRRND